MSIGAAVGLGSALIGKSSSDKAASAQKEAAQMQAMTDMAIYNQTTRRFKPALESGNRARDALAFELGLGKRPTFGGGRPKIKEVSAVPQGGKLVSGAEMNTPGSEMSNNFFMQAPAGSGTQYKVKGKLFDTREEAVAFAKSKRKPGTEYAGFQETPGYNYLVEEGARAIDNSAASGGSLFSGATLKRAQEHRMGIANQEYGTYLNRLTNMASQGQAAAGNMANAGANFSAGMGQALGSYGNAGAAGAIGAGNSLLGGINTGLGIWQYQNTLNRPGTSPAQANNMLNQSGIFNTGAQFT